MRRPKLKCADCGQRWVPGEDIDEDEAVAAVQEEVRAARNPPPAEPSQPPAAADTGVNAAAPDSAPTPWAKWLLAVVLGAAFATASAGLWVGRIDPETLPGIGPMLAAASPPPPRLDVAVTGQISRLPGGGALLEVTGSISNPGRSTAQVPPLKVRLLSGGEAVRDWVIPPPAAMIAPGQQIGFASSITDVPAAPITVQVRLARSRL